MVPYFRLKFHRELYSCRQTCMPRFPALLKGCESLKEKALFCSTNSASEIADFLIENRSSTVYSPNADRHVALPSPRSTLEPHEWALRVLPPTHPLDAIPVDTHSRPALRLRMSGSVYRAFFPIYVTARKKRTTSICGPSAAFRDGLPFDTAASQFYALPSAVVRRCTKAFERNGFGPHTLACMSLLLSPRAGSGVSIAKLIP
jgi:hypothetical protein